MKLTIRNQSPEEAAALAAERGMTLGQYLRAGGAPVAFQPQPPPRPPIQDDARPA